MADRLKVGFLRKTEKILPQETIIALTVDDKTKWSCSEIIDSHLQEKLDKKGVFGTNNIYIIVDNELSQTTGVRIVDDQTLNKLDETIREYLKELPMGESLEKPLNENHLNTLKKTGVLAKMIIAIKQENDSPEEGEWTKVITAEL